MTLSTLTKAFIYNRLNGNRGGADTAGTFPGTTRFAHPLSSASPTINQRLFVATANA
ncbi:protein of unknown function [Latilactobacillus sakei]|nr:protein of unknown function [Latilactobacillus sakei]